jgi:hypothetical protein
MGEAKTQQYIAALERALKPFADRVYNDNGDVTYYTQMLDTDDLWRAWWALNRAKPRQTKD